MNDVRREKYQVMPALPAEDYEALKADIAARGVMVAIEVDEYGNILDGYNRIKVCRELGINDYPVVVRSGLSEAEKLTHARRVNLLRRHLSQEQRRQLVADELRGDPSRSDRQIAAGLGVDHKTVGAARDRLGGTGEIPQLEKTTGTDGKARPVNKQHKRRLNSGIGKTTPSRDKKAGPSPMLDPRAWSMSTPQEREAFVKTVGRSEFEDALNAIESGCKLARGLNSLNQAWKAATEPERRTFCRQYFEELNRHGIRNGHNGVAFICSRIILAGECATPRCRRRARVPATG